MDQPPARSVDSTVLDNPDRLAAIRGGMLDRELDGDLQRLVEGAATRLGYPIGRVSLVMRRVQYFSAHVGLPRELAVSRSTDRCASFCQFAVSSGKTLRVPDAPADPSLPQNMVERYGIRAYLGTPVRVDGMPAGTLCVIDVAPRAIEDADVAELERAARQVERRLAELADTAPAPRAMLRSAARPALLEMRNILNALGGEVDYLGLALMEAQGSMALFEDLARGNLTTEEVSRASGALHEAVACWRDLGGVHANMRAAFQSLSRHVLDLEASILDERVICTFADALRVGRLLATHSTRNVGGAQVSEAPNDAEIDGPLGRVAVVIAAALVNLSQALPRSSRRGLEIRATRSPDGIRFELTAAEADESCYRQVAVEIEKLSAGQRQPTIDASPESVGLTWPARDPSD